MEALMSALLLAGPLCALLGVALAVARLLKQLARGPRAAVLGHAAVALALAVGGWLVGGSLGLWALCAPASAGNLCGLGGVLGSGPLVAGLALAAWAWRTGREAADAA